MESREEQLQEEAVQELKASGWKLSMIVLLVLFPLVMLEFRFLNPLLQGLNISPATFIGNAISVSLITWPCMPIAMKWLDWWLFPIGPSRLQTTLLGILIVVVLYAIEIFLFWSFI